VRRRRSLAGLAHPGPSDRMGSLGLHRKASGHASEGKILPHRSGHRLPGGVRFPQDLGPVRGGAPSPIPVSWRRRQPVGLGLGPGLGEPRTSRPDAARRPPRGGHGDPSPARASRTLEPPVRATHPIPRAVLRHSQPCHRGPHPGGQSHRPGGDHPQRFRSARRSCRARALRTGSGHLLLGTVRPPHERSGPPATGLRDPGRTDSVRPTGPCRPQRQGHGRLAFQPVEIPPGQGKHPRGPQSR